MTILSNPSTRYDQQDTPDLKYTDARYIYTHIYISQTHKLLAHHLKMTTESVKHSQWKPKSSTHWGQILVSSEQLIKRLCLWCGGMHSRQHPGTLLMSQRMVFLRNLLPDLDQDCDSYVTSNRCSVRFRSGDQDGQSVASTPSSSRNCRHSLAAWSRAWHCPSPGGTQGPLHHVGPTVALRIS